MAKTRSKSQGLKYAVYKAQNKQATNRKRKLLSLQKLHPNNEQITKALTNISYRRGTPKVSQWSHSAINAIMLRKTFEKGLIKQLDKVSGKDMFSIKARAHNKGEPIWKPS